MHYLFVTQLLQNIFFVAVHSNRYWRSWRNLNSFSNNRKGTELRNRSIDASNWRIKYTNRYRTTLYLKISMQLSFWYNFYSKMLLALPLMLDLKGLSIGTWKLCRMEMKKKEKQFLSILILQLLNKKWMVLSQQFR